jgi:hypothetical protein
MTTENEPIVTQCTFIEAWVGRCENTIPCTQHKNKTCGSCDAPATHNCAETDQFVCGFDLCDNCEHFVIRHRRKPAYACEIPNGHQDAPDNEVDAVIEELAGAGQREEAERLRRASSCRLCNHIAYVHKGYTGLCGVRDCECPAFANSTTKTIIPKPIQVEMERRIREAILEVIDDGLRGQRHWRLYRLLEWTEDNANADRLDFVDAIIAKLKERRD